MGPGGHDHAGRLDHRAVVDLDPAGLGVEADRPVAEHRFDAPLVEVGDVGQHGPLGRPRAGQHLLGQGGPVVGEVELLADHDDPAPVAFGPEGLGGPQAGQ